MRTRTRALAAAALAAAAAQLAAAQGPGTVPVPKAPPRATPAALQTPGVLPPTLPAVPAQPDSPEGTRRPTAPPPQPVAPTMPPAELPPIAPPAGTPGCATCATPGDHGPAAGNGFFDDHKGPKEATWMRYEYSMNWFKKAPLPVPIAIGAAAPTGPLLLGGATLYTGTHHGGRFELGTWTNERHTYGFGFGGFMTEQRSRFDTRSEPALARPFFDLGESTPNALIVASPGLATGEVAIGTDDRFAAIDAALWWNLAETESVSLNFFAGFRYMCLDEALSIYSTTRPTPGPLNIERPAGTLTIPAGGSLEIFDRFRTRNQYYGSQFGLRLEGRRGIFFGNITPRIGFGPNHQSVYTDGSTRVTGQPPIGGGLLAVGTTGTPAGRTGNNGRDVTNRFMFFGEAAANVGMQVTNGMRIGVGYNILYLNQVARPGNQIDTAVNPRLVPASTSFGSLSGPRGPNQTFDRESFYLHGMTMSIELIY